MKGLYTEETKQLCIDVAKGNPGALRVIDELTWFSNWYKMMVYCKKFCNGANLWMKYKDDFGCDIMALGDWLNNKLIEPKYQLIDYI